MKWITAFILVLLLFSLAFGIAPRQTQDVDTTPPSESVRLIFIHHSTGGNWLADPAHNELGGDLGRALMENNYYVSATNYGWGPDSIGDATDIPNWLDWFRGERSAVYLDELYNEDEQNLGDFGSWPRLADAPAGENEIIVFKSCFPNSDLEGSPNDAPTSEGWLSVGHAKYVYNELLKYFATRPDKLFVVVTAPPLSSSSNAKNARAFNNWLVNDWLAENNYPLQNVAVFDYYNVLTGKDNHHRVVDGRIEHVYKEGQNLLYYPSGDDHPSQAGNQKATQEFVPLLNVYYNRWQASPVTAVLVDGQPEAAQTEAPLANPSGGQPQPAVGGYREGFENGMAGWEAFKDENGATSIQCGITADASMEGNASLLIDFSVVQDGWATCGVNFEAAQDWTTSQGIHLNLLAEPTEAILHVDVYAGSPENRQTYYYALQPVVSNDWTTLEIPWSTFKRVEWEENAGQPLQNTDQILGIAIGIPSAGTGTVWLDDLNLLEEASTVVEQPPVVELEPDEPASTPEKKSGLPICGGAAALPLAAVVVTLGAKKRSLVKNSHQE